MTQARTELLEATDTTAQWLGINIDPLGVQVCTGGSPTGPCPTTFNLAPAALLPARPGEPLRADITSPAHVRGSGHDWPPEAVVDPANGSGRFPAMFAWQMLYEPSTTWRWEFEGRNTCVTAAEALSAMVGATVKQIGIRPHRTQREYVREVVLIIPNDLPERSQQALVDSLNEHAPRTCLLWRPIAAALTWCERYEHLAIGPWRDQLRNTPRTESDFKTVGRLLTLHLGVEGAEASLLELVAWRRGRKWCLVPGRRRPVADLVCPVGWRTQTDHLLMRAIAATEGSQNLPSLASKWRHEWVEGTPANLFRHLRAAVEEGEAANVARHWQRTRETPVKALRTGDLVNPTCKPRDGVSESIDTWLARLRSAIATTGGDVADRIVGAVVTGPLAAARNQGRPLGLELLQQNLGLKDEVRVLLEGLEVEGEPNTIGTLAMGAELFARKRKNNEPTYLDTLPHIDIAALKIGEPAWIPLLEQKEQWVEGGKEWRREEDMAGFTVPKGSKEFKLVLNHEEYPTVRAAKASLHDELVEPVPVRLAVSIEPAQGGAKVRLIPDEPDALGSKPVYMDWRKMEDTGESPDEHLLRMTRILPPLMPRFATRERWNTVTWRIANIKGQITASHLTTLKSIGDELRTPDPTFQQDRKTGSRYATAINSDGQTYVDLFGSTLNEFIDALIKRLPKPAGKPEGAAEQVVRVLGYTSTNHAEFQNYLSKAMRDHREDLPPTILIACGWCVRTPDDFQLLARIALSICRNTNDLKDNWMKGLGQILRFRKDATRDMPSNVGHELCEWLGKLIRRERESGNANYRFRNAALAIVYMLRRRAYDDKFLEPESDLAIQLKEEFAAAYFSSDSLDPNSPLTKKLKGDFPAIARRTRTNSLRFIGGVIDIQAALVQMIDYIDRRGEGYIRFADAD